MPEIHASGAKVLNWLSGIAEEHPRNADSRNCFLRFDTMFQYTRQNIFRWKWHISQYNKTFRLLTGSSHVVMLCTLTHCGLMTSYGDTCRSRSKLALLPPRHQAITWTNVDLSSVQCHSNFPGANGLIAIQMHPIGDPWQFAWRPTFGTIYEHIYW